MRNLSPWTSFPCYVSMLVKKSILRIHGTPMLQSSSSISSPPQSSPPNSAIGESQLRKRCLLPPPQGLLHEVQVDHVDQPPSTAEE